MRQGRVRLSSFMRFPTPRINPVWGVEARLRITSLAHKSLEKSIFNNISVITQGSWMVVKFPITAGYLDRIV